MTTIRIMNADPSEFKKIQAIINAHGFGILTDDGSGGFIALSPYNLTGSVMANLERDLLNKVGKHLGCTFS
jgi:hypothetical protein